MTTMPKLAPLISGLRQVAPPRVPQLKLIGKARATAAEEETIPPLLPRLVIPMCETTEDATLYNRYFEQGQFLSRQENWAELGKLIRCFDQKRLTTPGGVPIAEVLAAGARYDAVQSSIEAVGRYDEPGARAPLNALDDVFEEMCEDHGVAIVVALAHIEIAWAWRGDRWGGTLPTLNKAAFHAHFQAAARIVDRFDAFELDAPSLAAVRCALLAAEPRPDLRVADDYEDLIDLAPACPRYMRLMGLHLLPAWFGSHRRLELEARRTAARTEDHWGAGGYTWVYLDALAQDAEAFQTLDAELFVAGMYDILERQPDQHTVNLLAAFTGLSQGGRDMAGAARGRVASCFDWIVSDHLREVHPLVWMEHASAVQHACPLPLGRASQKTGRVRALSTLAEHFSPQIRAGNRVLFQPDGITIAPCA